MFSELEASLDLDAGSFVKTANASASAADDVGDQSSEATGDVAALGAAMRAVPNRLRVDVDRSGVRGTTRAISRMGSTMRNVSSFARGAFTPAIAAIGLAAVGTLGPIGGLGIAVGGLAGAFAGGIYAAENTEKRLEELKRSAKRAISPLRVFSDLSFGALETGVSFLGSLSTMLSSIKPQIVRVSDALGRAFGQNRSAIIKSLKKTIVEFLPTIEDLGVYLIENAVPALRFLFREAKKNLPALKELARAVADNLPGLIRFGGIILREVVPPLSDFIGWLGYIGRVYGNTFGPAISGMWDGLVLLAGAFADVVKWVNKTASELPSLSLSLTKANQAVSRTVSGIISWFQNLYDRATRRVSRTVTETVSWFKRLPGRASRFVSNLVSNVVGYFNDLYQRATKKASRLVSDVVSWFEKLYNRATEKASQLVSGVVSWFKKLPRKAGRFVSDLVSNVVEYFNDLYQRATKKVSELVSKVVSGFNDMKKRAVAKVQSLASAVMDYLAGRKGPLKKVRNAGKNLVDGFKKGIENGISDVVQTVRDLVAKIRSYLPGSDAETGPLSTLSQTGRAFVRTIARGIDGNSPSLLAAVRSLVQRAKQALDGLTQGTVEKGRSVAERLASGIRSRASSVVSAARSVALKATSAFGGVAQRAANAGASVGQSFANGIRSRTNSVRQAAGNMAGAARRRLPGSNAETGPLDDLTNAASAIPSMFANALSGGRNAVARAARSLAAAARPPVDPSGPINASVRGSLGSSTSSGGTNVTIRRIVVNADSSANGRELGRELTDELSAELNTSL